MPFEKLIGLYRSHPYIKYIIVLLTVTLFYISYGIYIWSNTESTDNAYIEADISNISSKVSGVITKVNVLENQLVKDGDIIAEIEDDEYNAKFLKAQADYNSTNLKIDNIIQQIDIGNTNLVTLSKQLNLADVGYKTAKKEYDRVANLRKDTFASQKALDTATLSLEKAKTDYEVANLNIEIQKQQLQSLNIQKAETEEMLKSLYQAKVLAERDLHNTKIISPIKGYVSNTANLKVGNYAYPQGFLCSIVSQDNLHIKANFKETQVTSMRLGMKARITIDSMKNQVFEGVISSFSPATGSKFALLPPDNATGNFTKVVQRIPVIINFNNITTDHKKDKLPSFTITPGMSAVIKVRTDK